MHNTQEVLKAAQTAQEGRLKSQPVWVRDGALEVSNCGPLAVLLPSHPSAVRIEAR
jgi:hypothetical protein